MIIDIIGAGIGGLTTAIALEKKGFRIRIFEQAEIIKPVGAGIILANNAMQVYQKLGLRKVIEENGNHISALNITKSNLRPMSKIDLSSFEKKYGVKNIAIHRSVLQQFLIDELQSTEIILNHRLKSIEKESRGYTLLFENGEQIQSSILIGADGTHSVIQEQLFPTKKIRKANQICWRGVTDFKLPNHYKNELNEAWGKTGRFGFVQIAENKVYWYALKSINHNIDFSTDVIETYFNDCDDVIKELILATKKETIHTAEIIDFEPNNNWAKENVCLLGDAAHAMTPNLGQGACQAIEDAYILSECMDKYEIGEAFKKYKEIRQPKAHQVVKASWMIGKLAHLSNPILIVLRNFILQITPSIMNRKQSEQIFKIPKI